jgi:hypothetical protein
MNNTLVTIVKGAIVGFGLKFAYELGKAVQDARLAKGMLICIQEGVIKFFDKAGNAVTSDEFIKVVEELKNSR